MIGAQVYVAIRNGEMPGFRVIDQCPVCNEEGYTVECQHCGADIGREWEKILQSEAEEYAARVSEWEV